uniref:ARAD1C20878p n=1 Tax=Blastobotrys adeninivorans TaxID=409370 RepID=A0A060T130_BLAAD
MKTSEISEQIDYSLNDPRNKWKILRVHWRYGLWALWTSLGSMMLGTDYTVGGQLLPMPFFKQQFGILKNGDYIIPARYSSAWQAIGPACDLVAAIICHPLLDKYGRKPLIIVGALLSVAGICLQHEAKEWTLHLAGRAVNGAAIGVMFTISPLWIGETCRPELRGLFLCFFNTSIVFGQMIIVFVSYGAEHIMNDWSWKVPLMAQYIYPLLLLAGYYWFPESPMWLIRNGNTEKAGRCLKRCYGTDDDRFLEMELERLHVESEILKQTEMATLESQRKIFCGIQEPVLFQCFHRSQLRRTWASILATSGQQLIGATFVTGYVTYFLQLINIKNYFLVSVILYVFMLLSTLSAYPLVEIVGRRTMLVPAAFALSGVNLLMGIMGCISNKVAAGWVIIVLIFLWAVIYQVSIGASGFVAASEVATLRLRAATQSLVTVVNAIWGLICQFTVPYMISPDSGNMGGKTGFVFFASGLITAVFMYFYMPETKGFSFVVLDELYSSGVPARKFKAEGKKLTDRAIEDHCKAGNVIEVKPGVKHEITHVV